MQGYHKILVAVDFSDVSDSIGQRAKQLAEVYESPLTLIHVVDFVPPVALGYGWEMAGYDDESGEELLEPAKKRLGSIAERLGVPNAEQVVLRGDPKSEILRVAEEEAYDLIVVGSHGRQGMRWLLGSTANAVLHGANCDVLAVRVAH